MGRSVSMQFGNPSQNKYSQLISEDITASFNISKKSGSISGLDAKKYGKVLFVRGYIQPAGNVAVNTTIVTVNGVTLAQEYYLSVNDSNLSNRRLKMNTDGTIVCESTLASYYVSFSFVCLLV